LAENEPARLTGPAEVSIERAAEKLIAGGASRAIFVSPEGDEAAAASVLVAREVADAGLRALLLDLTVSGAASTPMLESNSYPGVTNLLAAEAQFTDVIHVDLYSDCHVMPVGTADPERAMRAADRLPIILNSLTTAYDVVIVECGPADASSIRRLVTDGAEVLVSVIEPDNENVSETAAALEESGYGDLILVTPAGHLPPRPPMPDRSAA
jgi:Mrp family chromosome partitioning ATPase